MVQKTTYEFIREDEHSLQGMVFRITSFFMKKEYMGLF